MMLPPFPPKRQKRRWLWIALVLLLGVSSYLYWSKPGAAARIDTPAADRSGKKTGKSAGPAATPVVAARARRGNIGDYFAGLGTVTPIYTVTVRSRVDGELMNVFYEEGALVHKGDRLMEIDPRPYQVQLAQAEAQLLKDQASLQNARTDLTRYQTLLQQNAAPEQQVATQKSTVAQGEAAVQADQAQIASARLNLTYCEITAPITGRAGLRLVDPGNIVHAGDANGLVVITQIQPISVLFTIAEDQLPAVLQKLRAGQKLRVDAYDREMTKRIAQGTLTTVDNEIDQTTGTVRLRATFSNNGNELFPNQFVNARLLVQEKRGVVLLPSAAIQRSSNSTYVYLVKPDSSVTVRTITLGTTEGQDSEITSGLQPGDVVVMTGADRLQEGSKVSPQFAESQPAGVRRK
jgi:multidrug efflux system membrane fusion protein